MRGHVLDATLSAFLITRALSLRHLDGTVTRKKILAKTMMKGVEREREREIKKKESVL